MVAIAKPETLEEIRSMTPQPGLRGIGDILREEWGYRGAVISDDLDMGAIVGHYGLAESVTRAVEAGNDLVLLCHRPELIPEAAKALATISPARAAEAEKQIAHLREKLDPAFRFHHAFDLPFLIREHRRKYQWSIAEVSLWQKR